MKVVFVEEVDEILDELAYLVVLEMALRKRKALRKRRPKRLRLCAEHPAERVAVLAALRVERPRELLPVLAGARLAYAGEHRDEPEERKLVAGVHEKTQVREHVLDVDLLEDADARRYAERNLRARERHLHIDRLVVAAVEDRHVAPAVAEVVILAHPAENLVRLRAPVVEFADAGLLALAASRGPERLLELVGSVSHHDVCDIEDAGNGTVVALELHDAAPFPALRELHDVLDLRAAPRVDALEVVADGHDVAVSLGEDVGELRLKSVRVLVFVDENVEEVLLQHLAYPVLRLEELEAIFKKVVEVHRVELELSRGVLLCDLRDLLWVDACRLRLPPRGDHLDRLRLVRRLRDHLRDDFLLREVLGVLGDGLDYLPDELLLVVFVEDLEAARIADGTAVAPEEPRAYRVERAGPELAHRVADELFRPLAHLARRTIREGKKEYAVGRNAILYEKRDAVDERTRLASSCGGEHEERPVARRSRRALFRIE